MGEWVEKKVEKKDRSRKTETLTVRLDPKTKFSLDFVARVKGQSLTTVVERAIRESCDQVRVGDYNDNWQDFWDAEDGVRVLKLLACTEYPSSYDEDELKAFVTAHWEFFYEPASGNTPSRTYVEILWPKVEEFRRVWYETRESDYWAAGIAMAAQLKSAKVKPPEWPRPTVQQANNLRVRKPVFPDEIPF
ncbi:MAG TPA: hypothetical protein VIU12_01750, partial [Chryseolinea sp.]